MEIFGRLKLLAHAALPCALLVVAVALVSMRRRSAEAGATVHVAKAKVMRLSSEVVVIKPPHAARCTMAAGDGPPARV